METRTHFNWTISNGDYQREADYEAAYKRMKFIQKLNKRILIIFGSGVSLGLLTAILFVVSKI